MKYAAKRMSKNNCIIKIITRLRLSFTHIITNYRVFKFSLVNCYEHEIFSCRQMSCKCHANANGVKMGENTPNLAGKRFFRLHFLNKFLYNGMEPSKISLFKSHRCTQVYTDVEESLGYSSGIFDGNPFLFLFLDVERIEIA